MQLSSDALTRLEACEPFVVSDRKLFYGSRYNVCTDETVLRRRRITNVEEIPTRKQPTHPDTAPEKHDKINQKTYQHSQPQPASQPIPPHRPRRRRARENAHAQKQVPLRQASVLSREGLG